MHTIRTKTLFCIIWIAFMTSMPARAQLTNTFREVFDFFLVDQLALNEQNGIHGTHYIPASREVEEILAPALNSLIASNISSFPLSSTIAGITLDFSEGRTVISNESLGPIFAETANTIGPGKINIGLNYSYLELNRFRGLDVDAMRFTFTHQDGTPAPPFNEEPTGSESLGQPSFELDNIDIFPNLNINSSIFAFTLTLGITERMDISLAVPIINITLEGTAEAVINSFTYGRLNPDRPSVEGAAHRFGGTPLSPVLVSDTTYSVSANGLGDIALRLKYAFIDSSPVNMAAMVDVRLPTGDELSFLGTGSTNARFLWILSSNFGNFNPHLNIGYDYRGGDFDSNEIEYIFGLEQKLSDTFTLALDFLGTYDLNEDDTIRLFPGFTTIPETFQGGTAVRNIDLSNIPNFTRDNTLDVSIGLRAAPSNMVVLMGNVIIPVDDGGLRSKITPTLGLSISI